MIYIDKNTYILARTVSEYLPTLPEQLLNLDNFIYDPKGASTPSHLTDHYNSSFTAVRSTLRSL